MTETTVVLEPEAQAFADANAHPPFLPDLGPEKGREVLDELQALPVEMPAVDTDWVSVRGGPTRHVDVRIVRPAGSRGPLPVLLYLHGAGWVFGDAHTHGRLVRELAVGANAAVVFPEYARSPEARYPVALEQSYAVATWATHHAADAGLDGTRFAVAGDSVGGNMTAALTLMAKARGDVRPRAHVLFYPVTDATFDTGSYRQFAEGYHLRGDVMRWLWDQYAPDPSRRAEITACPLRASVDQLTGLPPALIITAEADVLRDEGEAYAAKLRAAGVPVTAVRFGGIIHDFVMLNALRPTRAATAAITMANAMLRDALHRA